MTGRFQPGALCGGKLEGVGKQAQGFFTWRLIDDAFQIADGARTQSGALGQRFLCQSARQALALEQSAKGKRMG
jgi:hypothetical protein